MEHVLDVSALEPPEPLEQILDIIPGLDAGDYLRVLHRRDPLPLYPMLEKMGFSWRCQPGAQTNYEIFIWRRDDAAAQEAVFGKEADRP